MKKITGLAFFVSFAISFISDNKCSDYIDLILKSPGKVDLSKKDLFGRTFLHIICRLENKNQDTIEEVKKAVKTLLQLGANINETFGFELCYTPLDESIHNLFQGYDSTFSCNLGFIQFLLKHGARSACFKPLDSFWKELTDPPLEPILNVIEEFYKYGLLFNKDRIRYCEYRGINLSQKRMQEIEDYNRCSKEKNKKILNICKQEQINRENFIDYIKNGLFENAHELIKDRLLFCALRYLEDVKDYNGCKHSYLIGLYDDIMKKQLEKDDYKLLPEFKECIEQINYIYQDKKNHTPILYKLCVDYRYDDKFVENYMTYAIEHNNTFVKALKEDMPAPFKVKKEKQVAPLYYLQKSRPEVFQALMRLEN